MSGSLRGGRKSFGLKFGAEIEGSLGDIGRGAIVAGLLLLAIGIVACIIEDAFQSESSCECDFFARGEPYGRKKSGKKLVLPRRGGV